MKQNFFKLSILSFVVLSFFVFGFSSLAFAVTPQYVNIASPVYTGLLYGESSSIYTDYDLGNFSNPNQLVYGLSSYGTGWLFSPADSSYAYFYATTSSSVLDLISGSVALDATSSSVGFAVVSASGIGVFSTSTSVTLISPAINFEYGSNPVPFSASVTNEGNGASLNWILTDISNASSLSVPSIPLLSNFQDSTFSTSYSVPYAGLYSLQADIDDSSGTILASSSLIHFAVASTSENLFPPLKIVVASSSLSSVVYETCSVDSFGIPDLFCEFQNAITWAITPDSASLNKLSSLTLASSTPFSYFYSVPVLYHDLFDVASVTPAVFSISLKFPLIATSTMTLVSESELQAIPFMPTLHDLLTAMMYILTALSAYAIVRSMFFKHPTV